MTTVSQQLGICDRCGEKYEPSFWPNGEHGCGADTTPIACPYCKAGRSDILLYVTEWKAESMELQDQNNQGVIHEHQCTSCTGVFWTN